MLIRFQAVFLGGRVVSVKVGGKPEERFLASFHQPKETDNSIISVVFPADTVLDQYSEYKVTGKLSSWVFGQKVMSRIEMVECELA